MQVEAERDRLGVLSAAVSGHERVRVFARETEERRSEDEHSLPDVHHLRPSGNAPRHRSQIARASPDMQPARDRLAEALSEPQLARMMARPHRPARFEHVVLLHLAEAAQELAPDLTGNDAFLDQHEAVRLVEGVDGHQLMPHVLPRPRVELSRQIGIECLSQPAAAPPKDIDRRRLLPRSPLPRSGLRRCHGSAYGFSRPLVHHTSAGAAYIESALHECSPAISLRHAETVPYSVSHTRGASSTRTDWTSL